MKKVITYGTFDLFHIGHLNLLRRASELGDHLTVGVSTDEFNAIKGKQAIIPYAERAAIVSELKCVDEVIPESNWSQKPGDISARQIDLFVMGSDWEGRFDDLKPHCEVQYLTRTHGISSTDIRRVLQPLREDRVRELKAALDVVSILLRDLT